MEQTNLTDQKLAIMRNYYCAGMVMAITRMTTGAPVTGKLLAGIADGYKIDRADLIQVHQAASEGLMLSVDQLNQQIAGLDAKDIIKNADK